MNGRTDGWMGWYKYEWLIFRGCRHSTASQPKLHLRGLRNFSNQRRPKDVLKITGHVLMTTAIHPSIHDEYSILIEFAIMGSMRTSNDTIYLNYTVHPTRGRRPTINTMTTSIVGVKKTIKIAAEWNSYKTNIECQ